MYPRIVRARNKDGSVRAYLQLVRGYRKDGKVRQELVCTVGRLDLLKASGALDRLIASLARHSERCWVQAEGEGQLAWAKIHGPVLVFRRLWEHLGLDRQVAQAGAGTEVEFPLEEAAFAMALHRILDPGSKRATHRWLGRVYRPQWEGLELQHLYRALGYLVRGKEALEEALFLRHRDLFSLDLDLMLFDTTSTYFEGRGPRGLAALGYSRDRRPDKVQVLLGLLLSREGMPVAHHLFPGNTADITAFRESLGDLRRRFPIRKVAIVADRGVVSEPLLGELEEAGMEYILGMPLRRWREVREGVPSLSSGQALGRAGRYQEVAENLRVKEVWVEGRRYIVCHNPKEEERDRHQRESIVVHLQARLAQGGLAGLAKDRGYRRYLKVKEGGQGEIDRGRVEEEARYDGKWVVRTNTALPPGEVALAYKSLWQVEHAFRDLKSGLEVRPVFLRTEDHVRGHILVCFLALVLEAALQRLLREQGSSGSYRGMLADLEQVVAVRFEARGQAWLTWLMRTELPGLAYEAFRAVGMRPPPRLQPLD